MKQILDALKIAIKMEKMLIAAQGEYAKFLAIKYDLI